MLLSRCWSLPLCTHFSQPCSLNGFSCVVTVGSSELDETAGATGTPVVRPRPFMSADTPAPVPIQPPSIIDRSLPLLLVIFLTPSPSPVDSVVISLNVTRVMLPFQDFLMCHDTPAGKPVSLRMFLANYVSGETPNHNSHAEEKSVKCACNSPGTKLF